MQAHMVLGPALGTPPLPVILVGQEENQHLPPPGWWCPLPFLLQSPPPEECSASAQSLLVVE